MHVVSRRLRKTARYLICVSTGLFPAVSIWADLPGSGDFEGLGRVAGAEIIGFQRNEYDAGTMLIEVDGKISLAQPEGIRTRILYANAEGNTPLMVLKNYEQALSDLGTVAVQYECRESACSNHLIATNLWTRERMIPDVETSHPFYLLGFAHVFSTPSYLHAAITTPDKLLHVSVLAARLADNNANKALQGRVITLVEVVESGAFEATLEFVDAAGMESEIESTGSVALYGIQFDTDKATLRPESAATLDEIVKLLAADPSLTIYVVGHTDDVGALAYNQSLSLRRAEAVVTALVDAGVARDRLTPLGVGPAAPLARNDSEEGRARNRRVAVVRRVGSG